MTQPFRLPAGGCVDRTRSLAFVYDGVGMHGYVGDTLASALLANGVHLVARSFKYHRPRGIFACGAEEPNALVQLARGARTEPNVRATTLELYEGLIARSQNCWPSVRFDVSSLFDRVSRLIPAGFYYKTFMWPAGPQWWLRYEHLIRRAAGMGRAAPEADPDVYEHRYAHCDVLVIGGGVAGLAAARAAAATGARVIVCDEQPSWGGRLQGAQARIDDVPVAEWVATTVDSLARRDDVTLLPRTTAFGWYDGNLVGAIERITDHHPSGAPGDVSRQRMWKIRARTIVGASGAIERPIAYADNDLPGTMLAGAARRYVQHYGVRPGSRAVVFTNNDSAYATASVLHDAGVVVAAVVDARRDVGAAGIALRERGIPLRAGSVIAAHGSQRVRAVDVMAHGDTTTERLDCDLVCVSGGHSPAVHLFSQARGSLRYDEGIAAFVPDRSPMPIVPAGAANGRFGLPDALAEGHAAGTEAAMRAGYTAASIHIPRSVAPLDASMSALWAVPARHQGAKRFVDLQNDVTVADIELAARENYQSVEHLKRYTTLGMGTDQGKTSNLLGIALMAERLGVPIERVGTTTFRPPYTPVTLGAVAGHDCGALIEPTRYSAIHDWHVAHGARFIHAGLWKRPHSYRRGSETEDEAVNREARNVRQNAGIVDVSTLGKIELQGRDVAEFLNRVYVNRWDTLAVGRCRYGVMLREDGMVLDDGTMSRLAATHYLMTTTTVNAVRVMQQIELLLQVDWPELDVFATSVTEQWTAAAIAGPRAREVVAALVDIDVSNESFPFLAFATCNVQAGTQRIPARLFRISYSGELAYEVHVPADRGRAMWEAAIAAGEPFGLMPYGTEAMSTLRIEKGHIVVGAEADGRTTADDLGMGKLIHAGKWCLGKPLHEREALVASGRWQLVGLTAIDASGGAATLRGAKIVADPDHTQPNERRRAAPSAPAGPPQGRGPSFPALAPPRGEGAQRQGGRYPMLGHVTSWCFSPNLDAWIALALVADGRARHGETLWAVSPLVAARTRVRVGPPCFIDADGARLRG